MENTAYCSSDTTELAQALMKVQRNLQPVAKDATNTYIGNRYATLNTVMDACRDLLLENNIWMIQYPVPAPASGGTGALGLVTKLTHVTSGQWQSSLVEPPSLQRKGRIRNDSAWQSHHAGTVREAIRSAPAQRFNRHGHRSLGAVPVHVRRQSLRPLPASRGHARSLPEYSPDPRGKQTGGGVRATGRERHCVCFGLSRLVRVLRLECGLPQIPRRGISAGVVDGPGTTGEPQGLPHRLG